MLGRCPSNGKRQFSSIHHARKGMQGLKESLRVYFCKECHFYHLTNRERGRSEFYSGEHHGRRGWRQIS